MTCRGPWCCLTTYRMWQKRIRLTPIVVKLSPWFRCIASFGMACWLKYFLLGSWYFGSKSFNSCWNADFSTVYIGIISLAKHFVTELVSFCHCLPPLSYFWSLENASVMDSCCLWDVDSLDCPALAVSARRLSGFVLAILLDSTGLPCIRNIARQER